MRVRGVDLLERIAEQRDVAGVRDDHLPNPPRVPRELLSQPDANDDVPDERRVSRDLARRRRWYPRVLRAHQTQFRVRLHEPHAVFHVARREQHESRVFVRRRRVLKRGGESI